MHINFRSYAVYYDMLYGCHKYSFIPPDYDREEFNIPATQSLCVSLNVYYLHIKSRHEMLQELSFTKTEKIVKVETRGHQIARILLFEILDGIDKSEKGYSPTDLHNSHRDRWRGAPPTALNFRYLY